MSISLRLLGRNYTRLTDEYEACLGQAASICLEECGHQPGINLKIEGIHNEIFPLDWDLVTDEIKRTWRDEEKATEYGAMGIAVILIGKIVGLTALEISRKNNGFDLWLTAADSELFDRAARLEVTGIRNGNNSQKRRRMNEKLTRLQQYINPLPAYIIVVEFGEPGSLIQRLQ